MPSTAEFDDFAYVESDPFVVPERLTFAHSLTQTPPSDPLGFVAIEVACADRLERICDERAKVRARQTLRYAIRVGKIKRGCCEVCAAENAEAHHEDYSKPLDVRWFCRTHHNDIHRQEVAA